MIEQQNTQPQFQPSEQAPSVFKQSKINWSWKRFIWLLVWLVAMSILTILYIQDRTGQSPSWWPAVLKTDSNKNEGLSKSTGELRPDRLDNTPTASPSGQTKNWKELKSDDLQDKSVIPNFQQSSLINQPLPTAATRVATPPNLPALSNSEILIELNAYRASHKIPPLIENQFLCQYAEKRVEDLIAFGGLDNHAGFTRDTQNYETLPDSLKNYPGGAIGENLAFQYCKNMTTGDSFIASTPQQLIEWCFDSSTRGHREAQLNPSYTAACVRNRQGYVVVIFGE